MSELDAQSFESLAGLGALGFRGPASVTAPPTTVPAEAPFTGQSFESMAQKMMQAQKTRAQAQAPTARAGLDVSKLLIENGQVHVTSPYGEQGTVALSELESAIAEGYQPETLESKSVHDFVNKNKGVGGALGVAAYQALNQLAFSVPEVIASHTLNPLALKKLEALKDDHTTANILGGTAGFLGSIVYGGPVFKGAQVAGRAVENRVAAWLAQKGVERGSKTIAKDLTARVLTNASKFGVEGAMLSAPRAITEAALGDPKAAGESLLMGTLIGGALGVVGGPTGLALDKLKKKFGGEAGLMLKGLKPEGPAPTNSYVQPGGIKTVPDPLFEGSGNLASQMRASGADEFLVRQVEKGQASLKPNAPQITESARALGLEPLPEQLSKDKVVQDAAAALSKRTDTVAGAARASEYQRRFEVYEGTIKKMLGWVGERIQPSAWKAGTELKVKMQAKAQNAIGTVSNLFESLGVDYGQIVVSPKGLEQIARNIEQLPITRTSTGAAAGLAKKVAQILRSKQIRTIEDLKQFRTNVSRDLSTTASPNERALMAQISEKLLGHEESSIDRAAQALIKKAGGRAGLKTIEEVNRLNELYGQMRDARAQWRELIVNFAEDAESLRLGGQIRSPHDFVAKIEGYTPEKILERFTPKNDVDALLRLKSRYPEEFAAIQALRKSEMLAKVVKPGMENLSAREFLGEFDRLSPEYAASIFSPEEIQMIRHVATDLRSLPGDINPSGTAKTLGWFQSLGSKGMLHVQDQALANVKSEYLAHKIRSLVPVDGILASEKSLNAARKSLELIPKILNGLVEGSKKVSASVTTPRTTSALFSVLSKDEHNNDKHEAVNKMREKLALMISNPAHMSETVAQASGALSESGAPKIAQAYGQQIMKTLVYLHEQIPKPKGVDSPLMARKFRASDAELSSFERKLEVVVNPQVVFEHLKKGTLSKDHIEALQATYPMYAQAMQEKFLNHLTEHKPKFAYAQRLKLSLLMGLDIDGTTRGKDVLTLQRTFDPQQGGPAPAPQQQSQGLKSGGLMKLKTAERTQTHTQRMLSRA